jgi:hypothetical protein
MNTLIRTLILMFPLTMAPAQAQSQAVPAEQIQQWILETVNEMPSKGGFELTGIPPRRLRDAFIWRGDELTVDPESSKPSYCTTSTYLVFYRVLQKYWDYSRTKPSKLALDMIKPNVDNDGVRIWGRWNSNGPATAKFFRDTMMGENFDDINKARPGDFLKLFWNGQIGKKETGHSVVYLGNEFVDGVQMIKFWASNRKTDGFGVMSVPITDAKRLLFSRLTHPERADNIGSLPITDNFLASMLVRESNWTEVRQVSNIQDDLP